MRVPRYAQCIHTCSNELAKLSMSARGKVKAISRCPGCACIGFLTLSLPAPRSHPMPCPHTELVALHVDPSNHTPRRRFLPRVVPGDRLRRRCKHGSPPHLRHLRPASLLGLCLDLRRHGERRRWEGLQRHHVSQMLPHESQPHRGTRPGLLG